MNITIFWDIIEKAKQSSGSDPDKQADLLVAALTELSESEILAYQNIFHDLQDEAYIAELWEIAYIMGGGCGDSSRLKSPLPKLGTTVCKIARKNCNPACKCWHFWNNFKATKFWLAVIAGRKLFFKNVCINGETSLQNIIQN